MLARTANVACPQQRRGRRGVARPPASQPRRLAVPRAAPSNLQTIDADEADISNLDRNYCDEFECTSSPAIEQIVRSLAKEIERGRFATMSIFQKSATYEDGFRSFTGPEGFIKQRWLMESVQGLKVSITGMKMLDKSTAQITWRAKGQLGPVGAVEMDFTSTSAMNLLTGRVDSYKESWSLARCSPPAAAFATASRMAWSLQQKLKDAKEGLNKATEGLGGGGDANSGISNNGSLDPTRFYQGGDNQNNDVFSIGLAVALLYLAFKVFGEIEGLH